MVEYRSAIVDECGAVVYWCSELTKSQIINILGRHEEWRIRYIELR